MNHQNVLDRLFSRSASVRRSLRRSTPEVLHLEDRKLLTGPSQVQTIMEQVAFPQAYTNFDVSKTVPGFDASLGTLIAVDVVNSGAITSEFFAENLGGTPITVTGTFSGMVTANGPSVSIPVSVPAVTQSFDAAAFDGTLDYSGTSGKDFTPAVSSGAASLTITDPASLALYSGNGSVTFTESARASGQAGSPTGSMFAGFNTQAAATITVTYRYIPSSTPSPNPQTISTVAPTSPPSNSGSVSTGATGGSQTNSVITLRQHSHTVALLSHGHRQSGTGSHHTSNHRASHRIFQR